MQIRLVIAILSCAVTGSVGCMRPWNSARASSDVAHAALESEVAESTLVNNANAVTADQSASPSAELPASQASSDPDFTSVLDKIEQVRAIDPAAEQALLAELRKSPPNSWPLVAEQFRASLAYREQLRASPGHASAAQPPLGADAPNPFIEQPHPTTVLPLGTPTPKQQQLSQPAAALPAVAMDPTPSNSALPNSESEPAAAAVLPEQSNASDSGTAVGPEVVQASLNATTPSSQTKLAATEQAAQTSSENDTDAPSATWQQLVKQAADDLGRRAPASPTTTAEVHQHVSLRLLRLLAGDTEGALEPIPRISPAEQDYWSKQLFALATYLDHHRQPDEKRRAAASVIHLDEAVSHLRELGSLSVRNLSFCKTVYGYGAIEPYDADRFSPGEQVSLYVEVENYHSKSTEKGFCTSLGSTYEISNEAGQRVGGGEIPDVNDCCRSRRRDFHIQYALALPQSLAPGRYQLQLVIKDRQSDKRGHATVAFEIKGAIPTSPTALIGS